MPLSHKSALLFNPLQTNSDLHLGGEDSTHCGGHQHSSLRVPPQLCQGDQTHWAHVCIYVHIDLIFRSRGFALRCVALYVWFLPSQLSCLCSSVGIASAYRMQNAVGSSPAWDSSFFMTVLGELHCLVLPYYWIFHVYIHVHVRNNMYI